MLVGWTSSAWEFPRVLHEDCKNVPSKTRTAVPAILRERG